MHALLAAERIVARARSRGVRLRAVGVVAALRGAAMLGASSRNSRRATGLAAVSTLRTRGVAVRTIAMLAGFAWTRRAMTRLRGIGLGSGTTRLRRCGVPASGADGAAGFRRMRCRFGRLLGRMARLEQMRCPVRWTRMRSSACVQREVQR